MRSAELIPTSRLLSKKNAMSGYSAVLDGYLFRYEKSYVSKLNMQITYYWKCVNEECPKRMKTSETNEVLSEKHDHNHSPVGKKIAKQALHASVRAEACDVDKKISSIIAPKLHGYPQNFACPSVRSLEKVAHRVRKNQWETPETPKTLEDIPAEFPEEYANCTSGYFFRGMCRRKSLFFTTDASIAMLEQVQDFGGDGTFKIVPELFHQLYVINARWKDSRIFLPVVYIMMPGKATDDYISALEFIKGIAPNWHPETITSDFEIAFLHAASQVFPGVELRGCYFHLNQSFKRHVESTGLKNALKEEPALKFQYNCIRALAFLPVYDVFGVFDFLQTKVDVRLAPVLKWFGQYYVGSIKNDGSRGIPSFPPALWSVYERTINDDQRTNNCAEGINASLGKHFAAAHVEFWSFIRQLATYQAKTDNRMRELQEKGRKKPRLNNFEAQKKVCLRYFEYVSPVDYIFEIAKLL